MHKFGTYLGGAFNYIDQNLLGGKMPVTLKDNTPDYATLKTAEESPASNTPAPMAKLASTNRAQYFFQVPTTKKINLHT